MLKINLSFCCLMKLMWNFILLFTRNIVEPTVENVDAQKLPSMVGLDAGKLFCSSEPSMLTEPETEYVVRCIKHIFNNHLVLQVCILLKSLIV